MGCTPEKLFKLAGDELSPEALAGTRPRGETMEVDNALAADLLHCEKDLREVNSVRDFLVRTLQPVCTELDHSSPFVLQLRHVQHICSISAKMARSRDESMEPARAALSILHPPCSARCAERRCAKDHPRTVIRPRILRCPRLPSICWTPSSVP